VHASPPIGTWREASQFQSQIMVQESSGRKKLDVNVKKKGKKRKQVPNYKYLWQA